MAWLDNHLKKNETGYFVNLKGGLFVSINKEWVRHVKGDNEAKNLIEITKSEFIERLLS